MQKRKWLCWFEIPSVDFMRAVHFYQEVLQVQLKVFEAVGEKMACFPDDGEHASGAVIEVPGFKPSINGVLIHFYSQEDVNNVLERVVENGGEIIRTKTKIEVEGRGYFALFKDAEGNQVGVYSDM